MNTQDNKDQTPKVDPKPLDTKPSDSSGKKVDSSESTKEKQG